MKVSSVCIWLDGFPRNEKRHPSEIIKELGITYKQWVPIVVCAMIRLIDCEIPDDLKLPEWITIQNKGN